MKGPIRLTSETALGPLSDIKEEEEALFNSFQIKIYDWKTPLPL
jgi:hypothetical protein